MNFKLMCCNNKNKVQKGTKCVVKKGMKCSMRLSLRNVQIRTKRSTLYI